MLLIYPHFKIIADEWLCYYFYLHNYSHSGLILVREFCIVVGCDGNDGGGVKKTLEIIYLMDEQRISQAVSKLLM